VRHKVRRKPIPGFPVCCYVREKLLRRCHMVALAYKCETLTP
jgi:hypothetical protein